MSEFFEQIFCDQCQRYSIIIEDDGKVCYAYMYENDDIIADIWLYNQHETPVTSMWEKHNLPFLNPLEFFDPQGQPFPIETPTEVEIIWQFNEDVNIPDSTKIYIRGILIAFLKPGAKPGWSTVVKKDGPLALIYNGLV